MGWTRFKVSFCTLWLFNMNLTNKKKPLNDQKYENNFSSCSLEGWIEILEGNKFKHAKDFENRNFFIRSKIAPVNCRWVVYLRWPCLSKKITLFLFAIEPVEMLLSLILLFPRFNVPFILVGSNGSRSSFSNNNNKKNRIMWSF